MKRAIFILTLIFSFIFVSAKEKKKVKLTVESFNGVALITTPKGFQALARINAYSGLYRNCFLVYRLDCYTDGQNSQYALNMSFIGNILYISMLSNSTLLLKTNTDEVIELKPTVLRPSDNSQYEYTIFTLSPQDLEKILTDRIIKVRLQLYSEKGMTYAEIDLPKADILGKIKDVYPAIEEEISKGVTITNNTNVVNGGKKGLNTIYDGF